MQWNLIAAAILLMLCGCQHGRPESKSVSNLHSQHLRQSGSPWDIYSHFAGVSYAFYIPEDIFTTTPRWKAETDPLPLAPNRAEQAAIEEAQRLRPAIGNWSMDSISLRQLVYSDCWFYEVKLCRGDIVLGGQPADDDFLTIPVLMNGVAVHPHPARND